MEQVIFPGVGLNLNVSKIAFTVFGIDLHWYAIIIVSALIIGLILAKLKNKTFGIKYEDIFDAMFYVIPISFISARLYYVIFNFGIFRENMWNIFYLRTGGLAVYGAIIGAVITLTIFCKKRKIKILDMLDYIVPMFALGQSMGRWGNFLNIEAYGEKTNLPWRMGIIENGTYMEVHPTFLYESIITFLLFIILSFMTKNRKYSGQITYIYLFLYAFSRFFIENLRTDSLMLYNFRISSIISVLICIILIKNKLLNYKMKQKTEK